MRRPNMPGGDFACCQWINLAEALYHFGTFAGVTQSQNHIKPLHWYISARLVIEGGFHPDDITPRPPFRVESIGGRKVLHYDPAVATGGERTILGGLKTKNVDVVVTKDGMGPVLAVSCKGMTGAFRNLTNRMEETIGECTNLHITYPAMVFGYLFVIRANRPLGSIDGQRVQDLARPISANDVAVNEAGRPVESIVRFHNALREMTGRRGIRDEVSQYEAIALAMVETSSENAGQVHDAFPDEGSPLRLSEFFRTLYLRYEERFLLGAPDLKSVTKRLVWEESSPALSSMLYAGGAHPVLDYIPRTEV